MAQSPPHRLGQVIGQVLELTIHEPLKVLCDRHGLYLDSQHPRTAREGRSKVAWKDQNGNTHDLDYVIERGGTEGQTGTPKAFVEIAWRRYTKHSRNKAQEIQGAILPLAQTYHASHPFLGVVLAGLFTESSLAQLRSHGFHVLYFPYQSVVEAFASQKFDVGFEEDTPDIEVTQKVDRITARLTDGKRRKISENLRARHARELQDFINALDVSVNRNVISVSVLTLFGTLHEVPDAEAAIQWLQSDSIDGNPGPLVRYEISVRYSNGDEVRGQFQSKTTAIDFLRNMS